MNSKLTGEGDGAEAVKKNVWKSDKSWEPEKIWKFENLNSKIKIALVDPRDMLNKFCFHLYAQKSLFIAENCNGFFLTASSSPSPVSLEVIELVPS